MFDCHAVNAVTSTIHIRKKKKNEALQRRRAPAPLTERHAPSKWNSKSYKPMHFHTTNFSTYSSQTSINIKLLSMTQIKAMFETFQEQIQTKVTGLWLTGFICKGSLIFFLIVFFFFCLLFGTEMVKPNPKGKGGPAASNPSELRL